MEKRELGKSGIQVAPWAFGGNVFGWSADEKASFALLDAFTAAGFNFIDTADIYSRWVPGNQGGESETIIGNWLKKSGQRKNVIIATKVGGDMGQGKNLRKDYIMKAVEDSLQRLQTDYIDLYQTHYDDESLPVEEILDAYAQLIKAGKVRAIGTSNMSPERFQASLKAAETGSYPRYETLQPEYNLYNRAGFEKDYAPICEQYGVGVINYYALASGFLSGKYRTAEDVAKSSARGQKALTYLNDRGIRILDALDKVAARYQSTPAAIAIAWLLTRPVITAPIASATSEAQLHDLVKAFSLQLDEEAVKILDEASKY